MKIDSISRVFIFCQAPADILYVLGMYDRLRGSQTKIHIIVVNVIANYKFLKELSLDCELTFIELLNIKNPMNLLRMRSRLLNYKKAFAPGKSDKVYFFSIFHDYVTAFFAQQFKDSSNVLFIDHYKHRPVEAHVSGVSGAILKLVRLILNVDLRFTYFQGERFYYTPDIYTHEDVTEIDRVSLKKYFYKPSVDAQKPNLLFYETNAQAAGYFTNYDNEMAPILEQLLAHFTVHVKGHPRLGSSPIVAQNPEIKMVPAHVPGEFIALDNFDVILGIDTTTIAHLAITQKNVFSIWPMFSIKPEAVVVVRNYLEKKSENKLVFLDSIKSLLPK